MISLILGKFKSQVLSLFFLLLLLVSFFFYTPRGNPDVFTCFFKSNIPIIPKVLAHENNKLTCIS